MNLGGKRLWQVYLCLLASLALTACSMSEEIKRIEKLRQLEVRQQTATSTSLTGEQIFIRSCNTCHPGGRAGMGPELDKINQHFPNDEKLQAFIRSGRGIMPAQARGSLNDQELANLIAYLRKLGN